MSEEEHSSAVAGAASAAKNDKKNDRFAARKRQAIEQLTSVYGFSCSLAEEAVELVSYDGSFSMNDVFAMTRTTTTTTTDAAAVDKLVVASYTYILDHHLAPDQGGPVVPVDCCPHLSQHCCITGDQMPLRPRVAPCTHGAASSPSSFSSSNTSGKAASNGTAASSLAVGVAARQKSAVTWDDNGIATVCPATENWVCLECGVVRCSRYCNGHALHHWQETAAATAATLSTTEATNNETASQLSASAAAEGHCVIISLSDLSVWCHLCNAYLSTSTGATGKTLRPLVEALGRNKFRTETDIGAAAIVRQPNEQQQPDTKRLRSMKEVEEEEEDDDDREDEDDLHDEALRGATNGKTHSKRDSEVDNAEEAAAEGDMEGDDSNIDADAEDLLRRLSVIAAERGVPLEWLIMQASQDNASDDDDDDGDGEQIEYPFASLPTSLEEVARFILSDNCKSIVILAGAGMSVASGIPDFRSADGLYATLNADLLTADDAEREAIRDDPTVSLQQDMFLQNPLPCLELQREFILGTRDQRWKATLGHRFVELLHEKTGKLVRHYTQNIDGLEDQCTKLPRDKVIAVHGSMDRAECARCLSETDFHEFCDKVQTQIKDLSGKDQSAPVESTSIECKVCGYNAVKPSIVLFKSSLPKAFFMNVPRDIQDVDLLIVMGTSLRVAPACSLVPQVPKSALRVLVNREEAGDHLGIIFDKSLSKRDYFAQGECDDVLLELMDHLDWIEDLKPLLSGEMLPKSSAQLLAAHIANRKNSSADVSL